jgi:hypothetical protein
MSAFHTLSAGNRGQVVPGTVLTLVAVGVAIAAEAAPLPVSATTAAAAHSNEARGRLWRDTGRDIGMGESSAICAAA